MNKYAWSVTACYVMWGVLTAWWKLLAGVNPVYVLCARMLFMLLIVAVCLSATHRWGAVKAVFTDRKRLLLTFASGLLITYNWGLYIYLITSGQVMQSSLGYYMMPLMMVLIGALFFGEKLKLLEKLAVVLAAAGICYLFVATGTFPLLALTLPLSFAIYGTIKKYVGIEANVSLFIETLPLAPLAIAFMVYSELTGTGAAGVLHGAGWLLLPGCGLVTFLPLMLFNYGVQGSSYALTGMLQYINPTIQFFFSVLVYGEPFSSAQLVMFAFVWVGVILYIAAQRKKAVAL